MYLPIKQKVNVTILLTFLAISVAFIISQSILHRTQMESEARNIERLLETLVSRDINEIANEIFDERILALQARIESMLNIRSIEDILIFRVDGTPIASVRQTAARLDADLLILLQSRQTATRKSMIDGADVLVYSSKIAYLGEILGYIQIHYSLADVEKRQQIALVTICILMLTTLVITIFLLNGVLSRALVSPVISLKQSAQSIAEGNLESEIETERQDEIGDLALSFDTMRRMIKTKMLELQRLSDRYRNLYKKAPVMLLSIEPDGTIAEVNQTWSNSMGYSEHEALGMSVLRLVAPESLDDAEKALRMLLRNRKPLKDRLFQVMTRNGSRRQVLVSAFFQKDEDNRIIISSQDITELKEAEKIIKESEKKLRLITGNMVDMISQTDEDLNITFVSPSIRKILGYAPEQLEGRSALTFIHPDDIDPMLAISEDARNKHKTEVLLKYRWKHANGDYLWMESATRLLYDADGNSRGAIFSTRDIHDRVALETEKSKLEEQLIQSQKLEAIGRLAGGIAHDINNMLSPIIGYGQLLTNGPGKKDNPHGRELEHILEAGMRIKDLVGQLLAFSRKQVLEYQPININEVVSNIESLIRRTIREDIRIHIIQAEDTLPVMADITQLHQVIMNLSANAADAMPQGGVLTIETARAKVDGSSPASPSKITPGDYVRLCFSDTGTGMDQQTQSQVFEPFFTTKGELGTGLGLATAYGIIKQHNGHIQVYSEPGKGTTFKIFLPETTAASGLVHVAAAETTDLRGTETILMVEDNEKVRHSTLDILQNHGYSVIAADCGARAVELFADNREAVDLLLTDVVMPNMNGKELYQQLAAENPLLKVLYMSGYTDDIIVHHGVLDDGVDFIQKPFTIDSLLARLRGIFEQEQGA